MCARFTLSPDERAALLREARAGGDGIRVPVRTTSDRLRSASRAPGGGGGLTPPRGARPRGAQPRRRGLRTTFLVVLTLLLIAGGLLSAKMLNVGRSVLSSERSLLAQLTDLLFRGDRLLAGEKENRVNILLLAIGGKGHKGENLADTVMVASIRPRDKDIALLSIPRDLYVKIPGTSVYTKINAVHAYRENAEKGEGPLLLAKTAESVTGLPIHYYARVDFTAFKNVVDEIGGVDITIPEGFFDYWHKISFPAGTEHMNGERALAYARARFVEGPQGGDFKRAERQQALLLAIRKKLLSVNTVFDLRAVSGVLDVLRDHVATNFHLWELKRLFELTRDLPKEQIRTAVLSTGPAGLLVGGTEILEGKPGSILRPRAGLEQYEEIHAFARDIFAGAAVPQASPAATPSPIPSPPSSPTPSPSETTMPIAGEKPSVELRNGTTLQGLAARVGKTLGKEGFTVQGVRNAATKDRTATVVVDLTSGKKPNSLTTLLTALGVKTAVTFPASEKPSAADFLVLLGTDVANTFPP